MQCSKCGTPLNPGERFCPNCGTPAAAAPETPASPYGIAPDAPAYPYEAATGTPASPYGAAPETPAYPFEAPAAPAVNSTPILVLGILSLAFAESGLIGLILAIIGLSKAKAYKRATGTLTGKAKVGKILSTVGLIFSIIMMVCWTIIILAVAAGVIAGIEELSSHAYTSFPY